MKTPWSAEQRDCGQELAKQRYILHSVSGVDVNSEMPERSRQKFDKTFLMISQKFLVSSSAKYWMTFFGPLQIRAGTLNTKRSDWFDNKYRNAHSG